MKRALRPSLRFEHPDVTSDDRPPRAPTTARSLGNFPAMTGYSGALAEAKKSGALERVGFL